MRICDKCENETVRHRSNLCREHYNESKRLNYAKKVKNNLPAKKCTLCDKDRIHYGSYCREHKNEKFREWSKNNPDRIKASNLKMWKNKGYNPDAPRGQKNSIVIKGSQWHRERLRKYNLTDEEYSALVSSSNNKCAICHKNFTTTPHIDHCHKSKNVRGLLCGKCNQGLGFFEDDIVTLQSAVSYLEKFGVKNPKGVK